MSTRVLASHLDQETKFCFDFLSFTRFFPRYYGLGKSQSTSQGCFGGVGPVFLSADLPFYLASYSFRAPAHVDAHPAVSFYQRSDADDTGWGS